MNKSWHVFYTDIQAEKAAYASICELGFQAFVPIEKRIQRLPNRKPTPREFALFPRYGFVAFHVERDPWSKILEAKGVVDILRADLKPIPVPEQSINALQLAQSCGLFDKTKPPTIGMNVEITKGPFAGLIGRIIRARTGDRLDVLLKFLNRQISATIPLVALREMSDH